MTSKEIKKKFLSFFKGRGHTVVPSSSLIPADPTVLLTTAGMQQFVPYLSGKVKPPYRRACSIQKCFRTPDIDEVGDDSHHTFFEMLGNWSFGDPEDPLGIGAGYFKCEAISWAVEFLEQLGISKDKMWITVFKGNEKIGVPCDEESIGLWQEIGFSRERIKEFGMENNFWGPTAAIGPCGPCSEIHYDRGSETAKGKCDIKGCGPNCACGRFVEIWNLVFMEYQKLEDGTYKPLPAKNVDTGVGLERLTAVLGGKSSAYETDLFFPIINELRRAGYGLIGKNIKSERIIADHIRGICFLIADGVLPSNIEQGYVLRRVLRRAIRYGRLLNLPKEFLISLAKIVIETYKEEYPELQSRQNDILTVIQKEEEKFSRTLEKGLSQFEKLLKSKIEKEKLKIIGGEEAFNLYQSYGFPLELTIELAEEKGFKVDEEGFEKIFKVHQEISRAGVEKKFGGVGAVGEAGAKLHTATHLLHQSLREVLGPRVKQMGSDITPERLRFDFSHTAKMTPEEIKKVEDLVNQKIKEDLSVVRQEMSYEEAIKSGALAFFKEKYPEKVNVYSIGDFSKEICAGPHVRQTSELGIFKIKKEESSGAGVRRIKAVLI